MADELPHISTVGNAMGQRGPKGAIDDSLNRMRPRSRRQRRLAGAFVRRDGAFVRREDVSKITSTLYLTVDQGTACAALHTPEARPRSCPTLSSTDRANNWMQDFAWDPLKDEIFMTQNIRTANGRQTIKINRLGKADGQGVRHFISAMTLTDAGHGDVLGLQRKGNALLLWISWSHYSGSTRKLIWSDSNGRRVLTTGPPVRQHSRSCRSSALCRPCKPSSIPPGPTLSIASVAAGLRRGPSDHPPHIAPPRTCALDAHGRRNDVAVRGLAGRAAARARWPALVRRVEADPSQSAA
jgi:hypothetical protein